MTFKQTKEQRAWSIAHAKKQSDYYQSFEEMMTKAGVPEFCSFTKCNRTGKCCGNTRESEGDLEGLFTTHPPCFFEYREALRENLFLPMRDELEKKV